MVKSRNLFYLILVMLIPVVSHSQTDSIYRSSALYIEEPKNGEVHFPFTHIGLYSNYVSSYQMDFGLDFRIFSKRQRLHTSVPRPIPWKVHDIFLRVAFERNFARPNSTFKFGISYRPFKYPLDKSKSHMADKNRKFMRKLLGTINLELNYLPYTDLQLKSYSIRPEVGFTIPVVISHVNPFYARVLSLKVNYHYNFYKNSLTPSQMGKHGITAGLIWNIQLRKQIHITAPILHAEKLIFENRHESIAANR